jgi:nitroimidazol reductase NimA-like FMN-containing flavoprotein (pyridoxamine 5'-phosphate oxidase superfamily)
VSDAASGARSFLPATRGLTLLTALARERTVEVMPYESRTEGNAHAGMHVREPLEPRRAEIEMIHLSREECLELLAVHRFGRLAVVMSNGAPVIRPINYVFDRSSQSVVFRTARGSKLHAVL